jgi:signal transduction histidine kinase
MNAAWAPVVFIDVTGSVLMVLISFWCAVLARQHVRKKPDDSFRNYLFLFTLAIVFFAISRSFGHLVKQLLLMNDMQAVWQDISPFSGAINSTTFVVIFAFSLSFYRFQRIHAEIEYYKSNLEDMIAVRTEQLEKSKNTLENILDNSNPINITNIDFDLVQANKAYYFYWPNKGDGTVPGKCYESRPGEYCHSDQCPLKLIIEGNDEVVQEVTKEINGELRDFITTARPFRDVDGQLIGMVESFQDITLRKQAERSLIEMDKMKSELISMAAHELNTPMSTIMGYTEFLRDPEYFGNFSDEQKQDFLNEIYDRGEALNRIINDLLDISRIESGNPLPLALQEVNLPDVLNRKVKLFLTGNSMQSIRLDLPSNIKNPIVLIDRHRINQVLDNLLNNAVKYSTDNTVITLKGRELEDGWEIRVEDRGIGMTAEQLDRIFDKFYRADSSDTATSGLGLGLSVAKQGVEAHGGKIWVESVVGQGTKVVFTLLRNGKKVENG